MKSHKNNKNNKNKKDQQDKRSIFSKISTMPSKNSLKWAGKEVSLLSSILLWTLWVCRLFSLLQISKYVYRTIRRKLGTGTKDKGSKRVNVPPIFCEIYFILWFGVMIFIYLTKSYGTLSKILTYYYLFESIVWVLYYSVFRRFFEESYSIYHELEYLTVLILVIPTQALTFANIHQTDFMLIISGLLGAGYDETPKSVSLLGALFAAIVISMIISSFPAERVKKKVRTVKNYVIGNGDVVQKRLYPALTENKPEADVRIYDLGKEEKQDKNYKVFNTQEQIIESLEDELDGDSVVWIETPSHTHVDYLKRLISTNANLIVMEKPITTKISDLNYVDGLIENPNYRNKIFFLSYYVLEKALPLYYLADYNHAYAKYLNVEDKDLLQNWRFLLGHLESVTVNLNEGKDEREWVGSNGGHLYETFIHNVLLASLFCGRPSYWSDTKFNCKKEGFFESIDLTAKVDNTKISLNLKKNLPDDQICRTATLIFSDGSIVADFDKQTVELNFEKLGQRTHISVKKAYSTKYSVQADLVARVDSGELTCEEADGLRNQIAVLEWFEQIKDQINFN